ncbi:MAG: hypothetical protein ACOYD9_03855 [Pyramidobacter sp.]
MIRRQYSALEKRALNQVCTAAERYDFDPPFLAAAPAGEPDLYLNTIIGLAVRWLDLNRLQEFFKFYEGSLRCEELDVLVWLALENCLFEKEAPFRPVLPALRKAHALEFMRRIGALSRQETMALSLRVYEQRQYRWCAVLGRPRPVMGRAARELAGELQFPGTLETDEVIARLRRILEERFGVKGGGGGHVEFAVSRRVGDLLRKIMHSETRQTDWLLLRRGVPSDAKSGRARLLSRGRVRLALGQDDDAYIRACFGRPLCTEGELNILNEQLCRGAHQNCRLYLAGAAGSDAEAQTRLEGRGKREAERLQKDLAAQTERNKAYFEGHAVQIASAVRSLTAALDTVLATYREPLPERSPRGRLDGRRCWRLPLFQDRRVFTRRVDEAERRIHVHILLDASASRLNYQEVIAAQTCVIVKSLENLQVPVGVYAFRSLRGFTVLQQLKARTARGPAGLFHYFAAGWNRDSLALSAMNRLIHEDGGDFQACAHVLFVLTDANPDDSVPMPPQNGAFLSRDYKGDAAVADTAEMVRGLRQSGIHTAAVYLGSSAHADNLRFIYGTEFASVRNIEALASRVGTLLASTLTELKG